MSKIQPVGQTKAVPVAQQPPGPPTSPIAPKPIPTEATRIETVSDLSQVVASWEQKFFSPGIGFPLVWYRGQSDATKALLPGALRPEFLAAAQAQAFLSGPDPRLSREKTINHQFRLRAASLLPPHASLVEVYFLAQHHGMPTRLLDWSDNPLAATFFAACSGTATDGALYVVNPRHMIPNDPAGQTTFPFDVVDMRDRWVEQTITALFPGIRNQPDSPFVLPITPDLTAGRILQQSARFSLHMPNCPALDGNVASLTRYIIPATAKEKLLLELRRLSVGWDRLFPDLDHAAKEIRTAWGI